MKTSFNVTGATFFPADMLRYEDAYPATEHDASLIRTLTSSEPADGRPVTVSLVCDREAAVLHPERWQSFGWTVTALEKSADHDEERKRHYASGMAKLTLEERAALDWFRPQPRG